MAGHGLPAELGKAARRVRFEALIFDFDGVLVESEWVGNKQIADWLTAHGHPTSVEESMREFMGLAGADFIGAIERWIGRTLPAHFHADREAEDERVMEQGVGEVAGAVAFVRSLPPALPRAICSSSSSAWVRRHLQHIGLDGAFGAMIFSGREHVARGKPAPDLYLHAAAALGVPIRRCAVIEDSPVGATGALASGATVIGLVAGRHCLDGHAERLRDLGVRQIASDFGEVAAFLRG
jgi:beta-phosphoglucomutase-like phosphatase (HAD superfamily)